MNISYRLVWDPAPSAISYLVTEVASTGVETTLANTSLTSLVINIDESVDHFFMVRAFNGAQYAEPQVFSYQKPVTLSDVRTMVKTSLKATATKYTDIELDQYIRDGIRDYSNVFPAVVDIVIATTAQCREYELPSDCAVIKKVMYETTSGEKFYLKSKDWKGGDYDATNVSLSAYSKLGIYFNAAQGRQYVGHFAMDDNNLMLDFDTSEGNYLHVRYTHPRSMPPFGVARIDVPHEDLELIVLYACGKATVRIESQDANLSRWKDGSGARDDNPMTEPANRFFSAYRQKMNAKFEKSRPRFLKRTRT